MSEIRRKEGTGSASAGTASGAPEPKGAAPRRRRAVALATEIVAIVGVPAALAACVAFDVQQTAVLSLVVVLGCLAVFFAGFEHSRPRLRDTMPIAVLAALGAAGRILFAPIPSFKPVSAIAIIAGAAFGRRSGFLVGALAALVSNFFFGQGPWTAVADVCMGPDRGIWAASWPRRGFSAARRCCSASVFCRGRCTA